MKQRYLPKVFMALIVISSLLFSFQSAFASTPKIEDEALGRTLARQAVKDNKRWSTIDHSKIDALNKDFKTGEEITQACISCHSEAATQFHKTIHWTWLASGDKKDIRYGKAGYSVNNFCISGNAMEDKACLSCHTSWNKKGVERRS